jgi:CDP-diglyceride synthetase
MHLVAIAQTIMLVTTANVAPLFAKRMFRGALAVPLDRGMNFVDGRPIFGGTKTVGGVILAVLATSICAPVLGLAWLAGPVAASLAVVGDLFSSFLKRRLGLAPSSMALGLDQIPESLIPAIGLQKFLPLDLPDITLAVVVFVAGELVFARVFFHLGLRDRPY